MCYVAGVRVVRRGRRTWGGGGGGAVGGGGGVRMHVFARADTRTGKGNEHTHNCTYSHVTNVRIPVYRRVEASHPHARTHARAKNTIFFTRSKTAECQTITLYAQYIGILKLPLTDLGQFGQ